MNFQFEKCKPALAGVSLAGEMQGMRDEFHRYRHWSSLRCWYYERIMWRAAAPTWENRRAGVRSAARGQYNASRQ